MQVELLIEKIKTLSPKPIAEVADFTNFVTQHHTHAGHAEHHAAIAARWYLMKDGKQLLAFFPHADRKRWVL